MASSTGKLCGPCEARHKTKTAVSWCMDCDDGLCSQCLEDHKFNKASKKHQTISVSQYVGIESMALLIKQDCEKHDQTLTFYCLDHYVTACALCVPEKHKQCSRLKSIDELASHAKTSTELLDIERGLMELVNTLDELRSDRQRNIDALKDQKKVISEEIKKFRKQINKLLDNLELELQTQLNSRSDQNISEIDTLVSQLKEKETKIKSSEEKIHQMKETFSDVQVFLATKSLGEKLREEQECVSTLFNQNAAKESVLKLSIDPQLEQLISDVKHFGTIQVVQNPCQIKVGVWEQKKAQLNIPITAVRDIDSTKLELIREIHLEKGSRIKDCVIVHDGRMIFADRWRGKVLVYTRDGQLSKSFSVDKSPYGLAVMSTDTVAVSCREKQTINIANYDDGIVKQKIYVGKTLSGLSYHNDKLYVVVKHTGIMEFDSGGNLTRTIPVDVPGDDCYLSSYKDRFCYTCYNKFIACCESNGKQIWKLTIADSGVTVDQDGSYFALDCRHSTLQIISADGHRTKPLLSATKSINFPEGVFFDKISSTLLVAHSSNTVLLYSVS